MDLHTDNTPPLDVKLEKQGRYDEAILEVLGQRKDGQSSPEDDSRVARDRDFVRSQPGPAFFDPATCLLRSSVRHRGLFLHEQNRRAIVQRHEVPLSRKNDADRRRYPYFCVGLPISLNVRRFSG
jgi:hypothetical protein